MQACFVCKIKKIITTLWISILRLLDYKQKLRQKLFKIKYWSLGDPISVILAPSHVANVASFQICTIKNKIGLN